MIEEDSFTEGLAFDGSSIRGWKAINASDMSMVPDASTAWIDPFYKHKTLSMICSIQEPRSGEPYDRCPRSLAQKALKYLESTGIALSLIHISEPTRQAEISYAVFCLKKNTDCTSYTDLPVIGDRI